MCTLERIPALPSYPDNTGNVDVGKLLNLSGYHGVELGVYKAQDMAPQRHPIRGSCLTVAGSET